MDWIALFQENISTIAIVACIIGIIYYFKTHSILDIFHSARDNKVGLITTSALGITIVDIFISTLASGKEIDPIAKLSFHATLMGTAFLISHAQFEQWREAGTAFGKIFSGDKTGIRIGLFLKELAEALITSIFGILVNYLNFFLVAKSNGHLKEGNDLIWSLIWEWSSLEDKLEAVPDILAFLVVLTILHFVMQFLLALFSLDNILRDELTPVAKEPIRMPNNQEVIGFFFKGLYICKSKSKVLFTYNMNKNLLKDFLEEDTANKILGIKCYKGAQKYYDLANPKEIYSEDELDPDVLSANMQLYYDEMEKFSNEIQRFWDRKIAEGFEANTLYPVQDQHRKGGYHTAKP